MVTASIPTTQDKLQSLESKLAEQLDGYIDFSPAGRAMFTSDASNYRQIPLGVVFPKNASDIKTTVSLCKKYETPVLMRGGGTSQNGQCVNVAIVIDCSRFMTRILAIDESTGTALVEPGVICDQLKADAESVGLTFGPDPATHSRCTLGGMIGNNSCGPHSMLAGKTVENVMELEILTSDGAHFWVGPTSDSSLQKILSKNDRQSEIYRDLLSIRDKYADLIREKYPTIKRRVSGYNLDQLLPENGFNIARALVGSEGTCVNILSARVRLIKNPTHKRLLVLGFEDIYLAGDSVPDIMPFSPIAMEGLDWAIVGGLHDRQLLQKEVALLPPGRAWLMVEIASDNSEKLEEKVGKFVEAMQTSSLVKSTLEVTSDEDVTALWSIREQGASATAVSLNPEDPDPAVGWEDTAVDPYQLGDYLRDFQALVDRFDYKTSLYGHFGDGCIHARINFDTRTTEGVAKFREFGKEIAKLIVRYGGSLSGEHGDGQAKAEFLPIMYGEELMEAFRQFKKIWDPDLRMNPGKLIDAYRVDENLRFGPDYDIQPVPTVLSFPEDAGGFVRATERCVGMGKCRAKSGAMCPSYQATNNEKFSTRGRAHLLHEMIRGDVVKDGWNNPDIVESLEHCLSCKACKSSCPTQVDIAAYKAEFMHKHFDARRRPLSHYAFGNIGSHLPRLAKWPALANVFLSGVPGKIIRKALGLNTEARLPLLATKKYIPWLQKNSNRQDNNFYWFGDTESTVAVLWSDSFNSYYRPHILQSAISALNKSGFTVAVTVEQFCCGRPLYEYGLLERGTTQLNTILEDFYPSIPADSKVIVIEPSCLSVFKEEMLRLFPGDDRAANLSNRAISLTQLLSEHAIEPKTRHPEGILHLHCHDKALTGISHDRLWMNKCFENLVEPEAGCCGMAGTFGLRQKTWDISRTLYSRFLEPALASSTPQAVVVTNGFSCHGQFSDNTERLIRHPVEIVEECL